MKNATFGVSLKLGEPTFDIPTFDFWSENMGFGIFFWHPFFIGSTLANGAGDGDSRHVAWLPPVGLMGITIYSPEKITRTFRENP